jgi:hypothetical protein
MPLNDYQQFVHTYYGSLASQELMMYGVVIHVGPYMCQYGLQTIKNMREVGLPQALSFKGTAEVRLGGCLACTIDF